MTERLAFIGTGIMGAPMAGHLLARGHTLRLHTRTKSKASALLNRGAKWAATPTAAAKGGRTAVSGEGPGTAPRAG